MQTLEQFGQSIQAKYPQYKDVPAAELGQKMLAKYPQYKDMVDTSSASTQAPTPDSVINNADTTKFGVAPKIAQAVGISKAGQGIATAGRVVSGSIDQTGIQEGQLASDQQRVIQKLQEMRAKGVPVTDLKYQQLFNFLKRQQNGNADPAFHSEGSISGNAPTQAQIDPGTTLSNKEVLGSFGNVALLATAPGLPSGGSSLAGKVGAGAALGYASDVANNANANKDNVSKPGFGTVTGAALPIVSIVAGGIVKRLAGFESGAGTNVIQRAIDNPTEVNAAIDKYATSPEAKQHLVDSVESTLNGLVQERNSQFGSTITSMVAKEPISKDTVVQSFLKNLKGFGGRVDESGNLLFANSKLTGGDKTALTQAWSDISTWTDVTPQGFDNLRQNIDNYMSDFKIAGNSRAAVVLGSIKKDLTQDMTAKIPGYAEALANYGEKSQALHALQADLLTKSNSPTTQLKKVMNIFKKDPSVITLLTEQVGETQAHQLLNEVAGAVLSEWLPHSGMLANLEKGALGFGALQIAGLPAAAATIPLASPKIVGKGAVVVGKAIQAGVGKFLRKAATIGASKLN